MAQSPAPRSLDSVLSFGTKVLEDLEPTVEEAGEDGASVGSADDSFEFAFAQPLVGAAGQHAEADDLFAHGRILPAYPVFDRRLLLQQEPSSSTTALPEPDTYCAWAPRSAPGSPARDFPKSASTGEPPRLRLRDVLVGSSGRSHSDGKEKFVFLQPSSAPKTAAAEDKRAKKAPATPSPTQTQQKQQGGKKKGVVTEMDMATAHRLFYSKTGAAAAGGGSERKQQTSYLTYRPAFVGFFTAAHAIGRSHHHPY